jgi:hypothetical protein
MRNLLNIEHLFSALLWITRDIRDELIQSVAALFRLSVSCSRACLRFLHPRSQTWNAEYSFIRALAIQLQLLGHDDYGRQRP